MMLDKAATLFSTSYRSAMKGGGKCTGEANDLGGDTAVRSRHVDVTKEDELLIAKTLHKPYSNSERGRGNLY